MNTKIQKFEKVKALLSGHFRAVTFRQKGCDMIRFNVDYLIDVDIIFLGTLSLELVKEMTLKRSASGLSVIIEI